MGFRYCALLVSCLGVIAGAMKGDISYTISGWSLGRWYAFGANSGAVFQQTITVTSPAPPPANLPDGGAWFWAAIASSGEFSTLLDMTQDDICAANLTQSMFGAARLGFENPWDNSSWPVQTVWAVNSFVPDSDFYSFLFISCTNIDIAAEFSYHLVNPNGEELSTGSIPLKPLTTGFLGSWAALGGVMLVNLAVCQWIWRASHSPQSSQLGATALYMADVTPLSPIRHLHWALLAVPTFFTINAGLAHTYIEDASQTGVYNAVMGICATFMSDLSSASLLIIILLLSRGWQVTRVHVDKNEFRQVLFIAIVYFVVNAAWELVGGFLFLFLQSITFILILRYIFASVAWRLRVLHTFRNYAAALFHRQSRPPQVYEDNTTYIASPVSGDGAATVSASGYGTTQQAAAPSDAPATDTSSAVPNTGTQAALPTGAVSWPQEQRAASNDLLQAARESSVEARAAATTTTRPGILSWFTRSQYTLLGDPRLVPEGNLTVRQIDALKYFRSSIVIYLTINVMLQVWGILALTDSPWIAYLTSELVHVGMAAYLFWLFRARANPSDSVLFDPQGYTTGGYMERLMESDPGAATPRQTSRFFVVQNPDSVDASGKNVPSVAIAEISGGDAHPPADTQEGSTSAAPPQYQYEEYEDDEEDIAVARRLNQG